MAKVRIIVLALALTSGCGRDGSADESDAGPVDVLEAGAARPADAATREDVANLAQRDAAASAQGPADARPAAAAEDAGTVAASDIDAGASPLDASKLDAAHVDSTLAADDGARPWSESPTATYRTESYFGTSIHTVIVIKTDVARGYCVEIALLTSTSAGVPRGLSLPRNWYLAQKFAAPLVDGGCPLPGPPIQLLPDGGLPVAFGRNPQGRIAWRELGPHETPCSMDIDLELTFETGLPVPMTDRLYAEALAVPCQ